MSERVDLMRARGHRALYRQRTFRHHDNRGILAGESPLDEPAHFLDRKRPFGNQDHIRPTGHAGVQGDPAGVTPHNFDYEHPVVALGRCVEAIDGLGGDRDRRVESERVVGSIQVVVDGLGHPDDR